MHILNILNNSCCN